MNKIGWSLTSQQREYIEKFAASFFEKSDDLIAVSSQIEAVIERRVHHNQAEAKLDAAYFHE